MQLAGHAAPHQPWRVGISDPFDNSRLVATVAGHDIAVATSGTSERGRHIINPFAGAPAEELAGVTVVGRSLTRVDVLATAAFAMGPAAVGWVDGLAGHEALVVTAGGVVRATERWPSEAADRGVKRAAPGRL
jgi:thiamine biosynthesis lipoprotein